MSESAVQAQIVEYLEASGALVFRMNAGRGRYNQRLAPAGTPDLLAVLRDGRQLWIEVKRPKAKPRADQQHQRSMHNRLRMRKQQVVVADSVDDVFKAMCRGA